jgi:hypothetical protein
MQILDHHDYGSSMTMTDQHGVDGFQRTLAPLRGTEGRPVQVVHRKVQQRKQRGKHRVQRFIDCSYAGAQLLGCFRLSIALAYIEPCTQ